MKPRPFGKPWRNAIRRTLALAVCAACAADAEAQTCPEAFDQTYEWSDRGYQVNGMRATLLEGGIANDPGPDAPTEGRQRIIIAGNDQVVINESRGWVIEIDEAAMMAGRRPFARARVVWRRSYAAAIGDRRYRVEESSERSPVRDERPRRPGEDLDLHISGAPGPAEMTLTLAPAGSPGFTRGPARRLAGVACVPQTFAPTPGAGPRTEACLVDLPDDCRVRRHIKPLQMESSVDGGGRRTVVRAGQTTSLRMGARGSVVAPGTIAPPPPSLGAPPATTPGLPSCTCSEPDSRCTPAQRRACEEPGRGGAP